MPEKEKIDVLIVDDEEQICFVLTHLLKVHGYGSRIAPRGDRALRMIEDQRPDLIIMDIRMPGMSGFDVLERIREFDTDVPVILMTALPGVRDAVHAMKATAFDYIAKPFDNNHMVGTVERALSVAADLRRNEKYTDRSPEPLHPLFAAMGSSLAVRRLARESGRIANSANPVMIIGEIGTGKRHLGKILHTLSERQGSFLNIDCTGASELILRQELFGSAIGTGHRGKLELADQGTLLLDEVSEIPWTFQEILSEALHQKEFSAPASEEMIPIACRLLFASSIAPDRGIDGNFLTPRFRELFGEAIIEVPPLRERHEDIPILALEFLQDANRELGRNMVVISDAALEKLVSYHWPGNVHQLKSTIRRATLTSKDTIGIDDIDLPISHHDATMDDGIAASVAVAGAPLKEQVKRHIAEVERQLVFETLRQTGWNKAQASRLLGVTYKTLLKKVSDYGLERQ
ncbi:MAG: sigma-54 dependent transcriptional regulator [Bacteroidota bacterium]